MQSRFANNFFRLSCQSHVTRMLACSHLTDSTPSIYFERSGKPLCFVRNQLAIRCISSLTAIRATGALSLKKGTCGDLGESPDGRPELRRCPLLGWCQSNVQYEVRRPIAQASTVIDISCNYLQV